MASKSLHYQWKRMNHMKPTSRSDAIRKGQNHQEKPGTTQRVPYSEAIHSTGAQHRYKLNASSEHLQRNDLAIVSTSRAELCPVHSFVPSQLTVRTRVERASSNFASSTSYIVLTDNYITGWTITYDSQSGVGLEGLPFTRLCSAGVDSSVLETNLLKNEGWCNAAVNDIDCVPGSQLVSVSAPEEHRRRGFSR